MLSIKIPDLQSSQKYSQQMLRHSQLKPPLTVILVLSCLAFLLEGGALGYQVYSSALGINSEQLVVTVCTEPINVILSNSNIFELVSFAAVCVAVVGLLVMVVVIGVGCGRWRSRANDYVEGLPDAPANTNAKANTNTGQETVDFVDEYFTNGKFVGGTVVYVIALVGSLGHFGLMLAILVCYIVCTGIAFVSLIVMSGLSLIAFIFILVCLIKWSLLRCKLKSEQNPAQEAPQNQANTVGNTNQLTRQQLNYNNQQTIYPLKTEQQQKQKIKMSNLNKQPNSNLLKVDKSKEGKEQYVSFNGNSGQNSNQPGMEKPVENKKMNQNVRGNEGPRRDALKMEERNFGNFGKEDTRNSQIGEGGKLQKPIDRNNSEIASNDKSEKHPTPKFILEESNEESMLNSKTKKTKDNNNILGDELSSKNQIPFRRTQKQEQWPQMTKERERQKYRQKQRQNQGQRQKVFRGQRQKQRQKDMKGQIRQNKQFQQRNQDRQTINLKNQQQADGPNKQQILRSNGGKPFFKSPQKPRENLPSYHRSPLQKYQKQQQEQARSRARQNSAYSRNDNTPIPQSTNPKATQPQPQSGTNWQSGKDRSYSMHDRDREVELKKSTEMEVRNDQKRQTDEKSVKKAKKTGMLIDYIRGRYAD